MKINFLYDSTVASAPTGFTQALDFVATTFGNLISNPISININISWGGIAATSYAMNGPFTTDATYSQMKEALTHNAIISTLVGDANAQIQQAAVDGLQTDTSGRTLFVTNAEGKLFNFPSYSSGTSDGHIGFNNTINWNYSTNAQITLPGQMNIVATAMHELSEELGCQGVYSWLNKFAPIQILDNYVYSAPGVRGADSQGNSYFSIDGGKTNLNNFEGHNGGDAFNWNRYTDKFIDAFDSFGSPGVVSPYSITDMTILSVLGYNIKQFPVTVVKQLSDVTIQAGTPSNIDLTTLFSDYKNQPLLFEAVQQDTYGNTGIPITIDNKGILTGVSSLSPGTYSVSVEAIDQDGFANQESFNLTVTKPILAPILSHPTGGQVWTKGSSINLQLPANAFIDQNNEHLIYSLTETVNGSQVNLSWLNFNSTTGAIIGTVPVDANNMTLHLTATNTDGASSSENINVNIVGSPPIVSHPIANQKWTDGKAFSIHFNNVFYDPSGETLTYSAHRANGSSLPTWIHFLTSTNYMIGVVPSTQTGTMTIDLVATNTDGVSTQDAFTITFVHPTTKVIGVNELDHNIHFI